ncbi:MAG TPA: LysR family transcriptional regulator [Kiloniellaceae bacterium]|nr:LysR family transcriptional regulator [Kiloniellaceae bacterium]
MSLHEVLIHDTDWNNYVPKFLRRARQAAAPICATFRDVRRPSSVLNHPMIPPDADSRQPSTLFDILRSFTTLARTLNLSETVEILGVTRQTVRRHIRSLEEMKGIKLLELRNRRYFLTEAGEQHRREAEQLLAMAENWLSNQSIRTRGLSSLDRVAYRDAKGYSFHAQQHHLSRIRRDGPPMLRRGFEAWSQAELQLEHPAMTEMKPYRLVYRRRGDAWLCVEIGERSSYATWLGWEWAKSAIGRFSQEDPVGTDFDSFMSQAYPKVFEDGGARLDHICGEIPRTRNGPAIPVRFQRLLLGCVFPDGEPALTLFVARTNTISISGLNLGELPEMDEDLLMEYDI